MWTDDLFHVKKPIIAMLHLRPLPGDPLFGTEASIESAAAQARRELAALQDGGVDGVLIANEFSLPYEHEAGPVTVAAMAYIIGRLKEDLRIPFGVNVVLSPLATIEMAAAVGADFVRNTFTGAYVGESGLTNTDAARAVRRRKELGAGKVRMMYKVNPESDAYLRERPIEAVTSSLIFHCFPDALCVSGSGAGQETSLDLIRRVKTRSGDIPVFCNTGCNHKNVSDVLQAADGVCAGTALKRDGKIFEHADVDRVRDFMEIVKRTRSLL